MAKTRPFRYPDIPQELRDTSTGGDRQMLVVGVLGKSHHPDANKMSPFDILQFYPSLDQTLPPPQWPCDSDITFYMQPATNSHHQNTAVLYMHIVSPADTATVEHAAPAGRGILELAAWARLRCARLMLLAVQVCHIVVLSEPADSFDASYMAMFKALRTVRDRCVVPLLPPVLRHANAAADGDSDEQLMGRDVRLCSPRFLFYFERAAAGFAGDVKQLEFEVEDKIYKMLRHEFVITNNSAASLFSIPRNKRFVYINAQQATTADGGAEDDGDDPLLDSLSLLEEFIEASSRDRRSAGGTDAGSEFDDIRPYRGFAKPLKLYEQNGRTPDVVPAKRRFMDLLREHIDEAIENGFDDSCSKFKGKSQFLVPSVHAWFQMFDVMHELFVVLPEQQNDEEQPTTARAADNASDSYANAREHFRRQLDDHLESLLNTDARFFAECGEHGIDVAVENYLDMLPTHYSYDYHQRKILLAFDHMQRFARLPATAELLRARLTAACDAIWLNGRQQCEYASLRGNPCAKPRHTATDPAEHASSAVFIAACNCGRIQGRRDDPYTVRQANYEFFQLMAAQCSWCATLQQVRMPVFEPSVRDYRAAAVATSNTASAAMSTDAAGGECDRVADAAQVGNVDASQPTQNSLFLNFLDLGKYDALASDVPMNFGSDDETDNNRADGAGDEDDDDDDASNSNSDSVEILINRQERDDAGVDAAAVDDVVDAQHATASHPQSPPGDQTVRRLQPQPSTTEYLPGMVHAASPAGLLPLFPSWSLVCIGPSSVYSHNSGLAEHVQSGFLGGSNLLLPWDVHVRLEHAATWAAAYERSRSRRKNPSVVRRAVAAAYAADSQVITLKVFIGCEYECTRGHRFFMASPERVLRGGLAGIAKDSGHRVVFNEMPLYVACPCRSGGGGDGAEMGGASQGTATSGPPQRIAQLMRVHIVTPKAPVNVIVDPRVRIGKEGPVFVLGMPQPPRLTQSSYWILRLPYVYEGDDGPLLPPTKLAAGEPLTNYGCLEAAMFGISEIESGDDDADEGGGGGEQSAAM